MTQKSMPVTVSEKFINRFWKKVSITANDNNCWNWQDYTNDRGYGSYKMENIVYVAHRAAYYLFTGIDPKNLIVCHHCDNPACCNPKHLFLGTHLDNAHDRDKKGRTACGENHGFRINPSLHASGKMSKGYLKCNLTEDDIRQIREMYSIGHTIINIARHFKIHPSRVSNYISRRRFAWVQ